MKRGWRNLQTAGAQENHCKKNITFITLWSYLFIEIRIGNLGGGSDFEGFAYVVGVPAVDFGYTVQFVSW